MLVKFGALIAEGRGKISGNVFSKNTYGSIVRNKVTPINPASTYQQNIRSNMTAIAQGWRGLTDAARAAFNALATQVSRTNIFGDAVKLTGFNLFGRLCREINEVAGTQLTAAPAIPTMSAVTSLTLTGAAGSAALSLAYVPTPVPTGFSMVIQATPQMSAGISYVESSFRTIAVAAAAAATPYNLLSVYVARFGTLVAANRVFVRCKLVHKASGFSSVWYKTSAVIAA